MVSDCFGPKGIYLVLVVSFFDSGSLGAEVSEELTASGTSPISNGSGGGVVAIVYPIHAIMAKIIATPKKAVSCKIRVVIPASTKNSR